MGSGGKGAGEGKTLQREGGWEAGTVEGLLSHLQGNGFSELVGTLPGRVNVGICPHSQSFRPGLA